MTNSYNDLTPKQLQAACLLANGESVTAAAAALNIARQTVSDWKNHNSYFQAEIQQKRAEIWKESKERLAAALPKAVDVLINSLDDDSKRVCLSAARTIIGLNGSLKVLPVSPTQNTDLPQMQTADECFAELKRLGVFK